MNPKLSIIIPCYNEALNLPLIIHRLGKILENESNIEVILVNNGSTDESSKVLANELDKPSLSFIRIEHVAVNKGYGFGVMAGLRVARGEFVAWTHGDMQADPADILKGLKKILSTKDPHRCFLMGRRVARRPFDSFFTLGMSLFASAMLGFWMFDINAQPKVFSRRFLKKWDSPPDDFAFDAFVYFSARKLGMTILTQPVCFTNRRYGEAKGGGTLIGKWRIIKRTIYYIIRLRSELAK